MARSRTSVSVSRRVLSTEASCVGPILTKKECVGNANACADFFLLMRYDMTAMETCALCQSISREGHRIIYQDTYVVVMVNLEPIKPGHIMVLPVRHAKHLSDLHPDEALAYLRAIDHCLHALSLFSDEWPVCTVNGWGHRSQAHLHVHVLPSKFDLRGVFVAAEGTPERIKADDATLAKIADTLRPLVAASLANGLQDLTDDRLLSARKK